MPTRREETLGARLRRLRSERDLSQRDVAGPGVSPAYVSRIERGTRRPSHKALRVLARKLKVSIEYLETGRELSDAEDRELRLGEVELELRLSDDPSRVQRALRNLLKEAVEAGDVGAELRARIGLGFASAERGDYEEAVERLEHVVRSGLVLSTTHPDVFATLGHSYVETERIGKAVELFRACLERLEREDPANDTAYVRFATYLSYALSDLGDLEAAEAIVNQALERADEEIDAYSRVRLYWSQARLASVAGRSTAALSNIRRAIALLETTEDTLHLGRAKLLYGELLLAAGRLDEARAQLDGADRLLSRGGDAQHRATLRAEQAKLEARLGRGAEAITLAQEALALLERSSPAEQGRARWALAEGLAAAGDIDGAHREFAAAEQLLSVEGRYSIDILRAWAAMLRAAGRYEEALELLERASELAATRLQADRQPRPGAGGAQGPVGRRPSPRDARDPLERKRREPGLA